MLGFKSAAKLPEGFTPSYRQLESEGAEMLLMTTMMEAQGKDLPDEAIQPLFPVMVVKKRVDVLKLPVKFSNNAYAAICAFTTTPGGAMAVLIDCLNAFEGQDITVRKLVDLYPEGFYSEAALEDYIDNYLKTRKHKWAEIY